MSSAAPSPAAGARVLVADDIETNRALLIRRLARLGITDVVEAADGAEALAAIRAGGLDLVLLDIMMPVMTGFDVLEAMAADGLTERVPVIVISALNEMDQVVRAIGLGADDFLSKPFDPMLLRARVLSGVEKKRLRDAVRASLAAKQAELADARALQLALVPPALSIPGLSADALLEPAREVGGDLVDHQLLPDGRLLFALGDVSDKGAGAALVMARTHALVRSLATRADAGALLDDPAIAVDAINAVLSAANDSCMFVTMLLGTFDPLDGTVLYVRCGHVPPFLRRADGTIERLEASGGLPLGADADAAYATGRAVLHAGDRLLILSDGVTEADAPDGVQFGDARVADWLRDQTTPDLRALVQAVRAHEAGGPPSDDMALLLLTVGAS